MMTSVAPNLAVNHVAKSVDFYCDILGFHFNMCVTKQQTNMTRPKSNDVVDFAIVQHGDVMVMLQEKSSFCTDVFDNNDMSVTVGSNAVALYFFVEDATSLFAAVKDKVTIIKPLHDTWYNMREFFIRDNSGYLLAFGQNIGENPAS